jgi:hypothetical protein
MEEEHFVVGKLDKLMVNEYWFVEFEKTKVEFQDGGFWSFSDRGCSGEFQNFSPKPFKYFGFWAENEKFLSLVEGGWSINVDGMIERLVNKVLLDSRISKMLVVTFFAWVHYCGLGLC